MSLSYGPDGKSAMENWSVSFATNHGKHSQAFSMDAVIMTVSISTFFNNKRTLSSFWLGFFLVPFQWPKQFGLVSLHACCRTDSEIQNKWARKKKCTS